MPLADKIKIIIWETETPESKKKQIPCFATLFNHVNKSREIFVSSIHQLEVQEPKASTQCCNSRTWSLVQRSLLAESLEWKLSQKL